MVPPLTALLSIASYGKPILALEGLLGFRIVEVVAGCFHEGVARKMDGDVVKEGVSIPCTGLYGLTLVHFFGFV